MATKQRRLVQPATSPYRDPTIAIVGAGMSGICMAITLCGNDFGAEPDAMLDPVPARDIGQITVDLRSRRRG